MIETVYKVTCTFCKRVIDTFDASRKSEWTKQKVKDFLKRHEGAYFSDSQGVITCPDCKFYCEFTDLHIGGEDPYMHMTAEDFAGLVDDEVQLYTEGEESDVTDYLHMSDCVKFIEKWGGPDSCYYHRSRIDVGDGCNKGLNEKWIEWKKSGWLE